MQRGRHVGLAGFDCAVQFARQLVECGLVDVAQHQRCAFLAKRRAAPSPIPEAAPVMTMTLLEKRAITRSPPERNACLRTS